MGGGEGSCSLQVLREHSYETVTLIEEHIGSSNAGLLDTGHGAPASEMQARSGALFRVHGTGVASAFPSWC